MTGPAYSLSFYLAIGLLIPSIAAIALLVRVAVKYTPVIGQIFEQAPVFSPLRISRNVEGQSVHFLTADNRKLAGTYLEANTETRTGVLVYCHEFLSDRFSYRPYIDHLRDLGFDLFTFDFRNHGESEVEPAYAPLHWASDREVIDLQAALAYLRTREDRDPAGFGLFGVSRGGTTALLVTASERDVWAVITDGAFPTRGTMIAYMKRWAEVFVTSQFLRKIIPHSLYGSFAWLGRRQSERRGCHFPNIEAAVKRIGPRPWLLIHGQRDSYIAPRIAQDLFARAREPKEIWLVPDAKHNRCLEREPEAYAAHLLDFLDRFAPRRLAAISRSPEPAVRESAAEPVIAYVEPVPVQTVAEAEKVATPVAS
jgi:pimeloyl-ACP methyl ester carboxylesterase